MGNILLIIAWLEIGFIGCYLFEIEQFKNYEYFGPFSDPMFIALEMLAGPFGLISALICNACLVKEGE